MKGRNINVGRHGAGSAIARSGTMPPSRTGSASGSFVGTGVNLKSKSPGRYTGSAPRSGTDSQPESFVNQPPSPWDNSQPSSNPTSGAPSAGPSARVGGPGGKTGAAGVASGRLAGSAGIGTRPTSNFPAAATGPKGGLGQENGKVIGKSQPRRVGNVYNQPKGSSAGGFKGRGGAPSFYGR